MEEGQQEFKGRSNKEESQKTWKVLRSNWKKVNVGGGERSKKDLRVKERGEWRSKNEWKQRVYFSGRSNCPADECPEKISFKEETEGKNNVEICKGDGTLELIQLHHF